MKNMKKLFIVLILLYSIIPIIIVKYLTDFQINYFYLIPAYGFILTTFLCFGCKWRIFTSLFKNIRYFMLVKMEIISRLMHMISPFQLDIPARAIILKERGIKAAHTVSLSLFDLFTNTIFCLLVIIIVSAGMISKSFSFYLIPVLLILFIIIIVKYPINFLRRLSKKIGNKYLKRIVKFLIELPVTVKIFLKHPQKIVAYVLAMLSIWIVRWLTIFAIALAFGITLPIPAVALAVCFGSIATFLSRIPAGLGVVEITAILILQEYASAGIIFSIFLIDRLLSIVTVTLFGGYFLASESKGYLKRSIKLLKRFRD